MWNIHMLKNLSDELCEVQFTVDRILQVMLMTTDHSNIYKI